MRAADSCRAVAAPRARPRRWLAGGPGQGSRWTESTGRPPSGARPECRAARPSVSPGRGSAPDCGAAVAGGRAARGTRSASPGLGRRPRGWRPGGAATRASRLVAGAARGLRRRLERRFSGGIAAEASTRSTAPVRPAASPRPVAHHAHAPAATVPGHGAEGRGHEAHRSETGCLLFVLGLGPHTASWLQLPAACGQGNKKNDRDTATTAATATITSAELKKNNGKFAKAAKTGSSR